MSMKQSLALRNALAQVYADVINAGTGAGTLEIYTGTQPASADDDVTTQTLLGTLTFSDPCEADVSSGVLTFDTITQDAAADATGTATWARIKDSDGNTVLDLSVGAPGSGAGIEFNTTSIVAGGPINVTSFTITIPAG